MTWKPYHLLFDAADAINKETNSTSSSPSPSPSIPASSSKQVNQSGDISQGLKTLPNNTNQVNKSGSSFFSGDVTQMSENGIRSVTNSKLGTWANDQTNKLIEKVRTGASLSFNKKLGAGAGAIKALGDFGNADAITQLMIIILVFLFFVIFLWCYNKLSLNKKNCTALTKLYDDFPLISSINASNPIYQYKLRDYYIKTAYNCCSAGKYKNDFVNLCALKSCIKQGARCLDFEIYSINDLPVISVSSKLDYSSKEAYNNVFFSDAMTVISSYAFSGNTCPNPNDPLILHFRIMSNNPLIHDQMAMILYNTLEDRLLGKKFSYESDGLNLGSYGPITKLMGKVIIMVDKSNPLFTSTKLNEYVNIASNSVFLRNMRYTDVKFCPDADELLYYNKQNMTIVLPDLSASNKNFSPAVAMTYGCQMLAMSFQNFDANMDYYTQLFDDYGSAFILRDKKYRYIPLFIVLPPAQNPNYSYSDRTIPLLDGIKPLVL
jgi:hypothetical protein